jgi:AAA ATPase domain
LTDLLIEEIKDCILELESTGHTGGAKIPPRGNVTSGTCKWLKEVTEYGSWIEPEDPTRFLWIYGPPGKGKTFLSIYVANELRQQKKWILQYFCHSGDNRRNTAYAVLTGFLNELLHYIEELPHDSSEFAKRDYLHTVVRGQLTAIKKETEAPHEALWYAFEKLICVIRKNIYIVLDGLDECEKSSIDFLTEKFEAMYSSNSEGSQKVWTLIVSRNLDIKSKSAVTIDLDEHTREIDRDLLWFIHHGVAQFFVCREENKRLDRLEIRKLYKKYESGELKQLGPRGKLCNILLDRANKTYLWVALAMGMLNSDAAERIIESEDAVDKLLPKGLNAIVNRMLLEALESEDEPRRGINPENTAEIIRWVSLAFRPLTVAEIRAATGVTDDNIRRCKHILSLPKEIIEGGKVNDEMELRLVHQSLKEYLLQPSLAFRFPSSIGLLLRPYLLRPAGRLVRRAYGLPLLEHSFAAAIALATWNHFPYALTFPVVAVYGSALWTLGPRKFHPVRSFLEKLHQSLKLCIFSVDERGAHKDIFVRCLNSMQNHLPMNPDLESAGGNRRRKDLDYACQYWARHLHRGEEHLNFHTVPTFSQERPLHRLRGLGFMGGMSWFQPLQRGRLLNDHGLVHQFLLKRLLHWFEALCLMKKISEGFAALEILEPMVSYYQTTLETLDSLPVRLVKVSTFVHLLETPIGSSLAVSQLLNKSHFKSIRLPLYLRHMRALLKKRLRDRCNYSLKADFRSKSNGVHYCGGSRAIVATSAWSSSRPTANLSRQHPVMGLSSSGK